MITLSPLKSFHIGIYKKWKFLINNRLLPFSHIKVARKFVELQNRNVLISLNPSSSLGPKRTVIEVPKDEMMYKEFRHRGEWKKDVSNFLSSCIRDLKRELGNTSLSVRVVPSDQITEIRTQMLNSEKFSNKYLATNDHFVIKSDLQEFDAKVLARLNKRIWERTYAASVGIGALHEIERQDITNLIGNSKYLNKISWSSSFTNIVNLEGVQEFWLSRTNTNGNVYLKK